MARKKNVLLVGHIDHQLMYSSFCDALKNEKKIVLQTKDAPVYGLGTIGFENHCISEDIDVVIFCGEEHAEKTKVDFAKENATKSILILTAAEAKKLYKNGATQFSQNVIDAHNAYIGKSIPRAN